MRFLVTGSDTVPGKNILDALQREGFECQGFGQAWPLQAQASAELRDYRPNLIINAHQMPGIAACEADSDACNFHNVEVARQLVEYAVEQDAAFIQLSSCYVFDGSKKMPYKSSSQGNPLCQFGRAKWAAEQLVRDALKRSLVLRLGWLIGVEPERLFERLETAQAEGVPAFFSDGHRGNPTAPDDVARVVVAIAKQLLCDAPVWGVYQYAGAEVVSQLAFARAAAEYMMEPGQVEELVRCATPEQVTAVYEPPNSALGCIKIRNTFGIKQRPWRNYLQSIIKHREPALKPEWCGHEQTTRISLSS